MTEPMAGPELPFWRKLAPEPGSAPVDPGALSAAPDVTPQAAPLPLAPQVPSYVPEPYPQHAYGYSAQPYPPQPQGYGGQPYSPQPQGYGGQPYPPQPYGYAPLPHYSQPGSRRRTIAIVTGILVLVVIAFGAAYGVKRHESSAPNWYPSGAIPAPNPSDPCITPASAATSPAAAKYLAAVAAATPMWEQIDRTLAKQGDMSRRNDLIAQVHGDALFLAGLKSIDFPANLQRAGANLIAIVTSYDTMLQAGTDDPGYMSANLSQLHEASAVRADASSALRSALGLPQANCSYRRP